MRQRHNRSSIGTIDSDERGPMAGVAGSCLSGTVWRREGSAKQMSAVSYWSKPVASGRGRRGSPADETRSDCGRGAQ